uniref:F-box domain-containing protein n=1 Tax=Chaetoceros debilis TaxID=122233 RepID=A0A7S3QJ38_9STRA
MRHSLHNRYQSDQRKREKEEMQDYLHKAKRPRIDSEAKITDVTRESIAEDDRRSLLNRASLSRVCFKVPIDNLCGGIIRNIYSMMNDPRDIWNFSRCNKRLRDLVDYRSVIRAATFNSVLDKKEAPIKSLGRITRCLDRNIIFVPSPQRLLRLMIGSRCEMGSNCWSYNRVNDAAPIVRNCRESSLFICTECANNTHSSLRDRSHAAFVQKQMYQLRSETRTQVSYQPPNIPMHEHSAGGDAVGYYFSVRDLKQMAATVFTKKDTPELERKRKEFLATQANTRISTDPNRESRLKIIDTIHEAIDDSKALHDRIKAIKRTQDIGRFSLKQERYRAVHTKIAGLIGDVEWKEDALECSWGTYCKFEVAEYKCPLVDNILKPLISAPSSATKTRITAAADRISEQFNMIQQSGFFDYEYLSQDDPYENAIRNYAIENFNRSQICSSLQEKHLVHLHQGRPSDAIADLFQGHSYFRDAFLPLIDAESCTEVFTPIDFLKYASELWNNLVFPRHELSRDMTGMKQFIKHIIGVFDQHKSFILRYLSHDRTLAFLTDDVEFEPRHGLSRAEIVRRCLIRANTQDPSSFLGTPFWKLLTLHHSVHGNPEAQMLSDDTAYKFSSLDRSSWNHYGDNSGQI